MSEEISHFEGKMKIARYRWLLNIFLAIIIFYLAEMSRLFGLHGIPLAISPVWPATGFSLAALFLYGYGMCPGILIGNLFYNFSQLHSPDHLVASFITSLVISFGSLLEAIIGFYIMRRFASPYYFSTVKDVIIFLVPVAGLGCLTAATVGTATLAIFGNLNWKTATPIWRAFFIGDLMGVYIFTPLIVVWMTTEIVVKLKAYSYEALCMLIFFLTISFLTFFKGYPLAHFYIPLAMWVSFRYRLHGATVAIFLISLVAIGFTSIGVGYFITEVTSYSRMLLLVSTLEIIVAVSLIVATLTNERDSVIHLLEHQNIDLRQTMQLHIEAIKEMAKDVTIKEKLTSLGLVTSNLANYLHIPLNKISNAAKSCMLSLQELENLRKYPDESDYNLFNLYERISQNLNTIYDFGSNADIIATMIQFQTSLSEPNRTKAKSMHLNTLLNMSLNQASQQMAQQHPGFSYILTKEFDKKIKTFFILPGDLASVFNKLFENAFHSMKQKMDLYSYRYTPRLDVMSIEHDKYIEIIIQDNGLGMTEESAKHLFQSFVENTGSEEEIINIGLSLAHDIIVSVYHGEIRAESVKGEYFKHIVILPKEL